MLEELDIPRAISAPPHLDDRWAAQLVRAPSGTRMRCALSRFLIESVQAVHLLAALCTSRRQQIRTPAAVPSFDAGQQLHVAHRRC